MSSDEHERFRFNLREFIQTELELGITFASLALDSITEEKRRRNQQNARKAYDTAVRFCNRFPVTQQSQQGGFPRMSKLRRLLLQLGEEIEE